MADLSNDLARELLLAYEPVLYFDSDNKVLPLDTDVYVRHCSLWQTPRPAFSFRQPAMVKDWGTLTRADLAQYRSPAKSIYYLAFAQLDQATTQARQRQGISTTTSHIINQGLEQYAALSPAERRPTYHGRAFYSRDYLVLQYWFFYPLNDFKTSHGGINDHEGDWEGVSLFLPKNRGQPEAAAVMVEDWLPLKLLAAAHEGASAKDWDAIGRQGSHPIFYVARGSHATYYEPGRHFPDRADGRGVKVGPGTENPWNRLVFPVEDLPAWAGQYDGAWGYYSRDALGGFNGPGGLQQTIKYSWFKGLSFAPRTTWTDPVGEAGL